MKVLIVGTGNMGSAVSKRLKEAGFEVCLWNRTWNKAEKLAKEIGGISIKDFIEGIQRCEAVISFVSDDQALMEIVARVPRADGLLFINSSTVSPLTSQKISKYLENKGVCYVEAPVLGGPSAIKRGEVITIISGRNICKNASKVIIEKFSSKIIDLDEEPEKAQVLKLTFNSLLITTLEALSEAILISESYDIPFEMIKEIFKDTVFEQIASKYLDRFLRKEQKPSFRLTLASKDLYDAIVAANSKGSPVPTISAAYNTYTMAAKYGFENDDYSKIYWFLKGNLH